MTLDALYKNFVEQLRSIYDGRESGNIADWVFENITAIRRLDRITNPHQIISNSVIQQLNTALQQLLQHKPVQYVLGEAWFYKMKLKVNEHVLIPRPETEELVEWVVEEIRNKLAGMIPSNGKLEIRNNEVEEITILDIGTGSGCIAIALKKELPYAGIMAIDISDDALSIAKLNATAQNVNIEFKQADFLEERSWALLQSFDIIVSNPPYIPENQKTTLAKHVTDHEPHLALFVTNHDPFIFYRKIADFAAEHLNKEGEIFVEVHEEYSKEVQQIFSDKNFSSEIRKDIYGRKRMIKAFR